MPDCKNNYVIKSIRKLQIYLICLDLENFRVSVISTEFQIPFIVKRACCLKFYKSMVFFYFYFAAVLDNHIFSLPTNSTGKIHQK